VTSFEHALVTGGSSGIGKETARRFARLGAHVTLLARRQPLLDQARAEIEAERQRPEQKVLAISVDVSRREALEAAVRQAEAAAGPPDVLVACAGIARPGYFHEVPIEVFEETLRINYLGTLYAVRAVEPLMRARGRGHIVLISSGAGIVGLFGYTPYAPTKFAQRGLAESLRGELKRFGIGVSICYPPDTDTPQLAEENRTKPAETKAITGAAKLWQPGDVAEAIVRGVQRNQFAITPGWEMTWLLRLHSLLRPALNFWFDRLAAGAARPRA
jgi:3-dehydrosphinganine reductase